MLQGIWLERSLDSGMFLERRLPWSLRQVSAYNAGDPGLIPGWRRSSGEGNGNPLQYPYLENPMGGAW